jgi:hypothetical protein
VRRILLGAAVLGLLTASCIDDFEQAAVTAGQDGGLRVVYYPCAARRPAETVQLLVDDGDTLGDGNEMVLWEAKAASDPIQVSELMTFGPTTLPGGYSETVHLRTPARGRKVAVYMTFRGGGSFTARFSWGALDEGKLLTDDGTKTPEEWLRYAREGCGGG